ncbi:hypothetical protein M9Y10_042895 [Tritrichomonas musculus]|uniref:Uncharacterized protein n=1 Tax=Tritrichomonas musculus TaxID=1915356 RepID=A0ABR2JY49_9EUKA
MSNFNISKLENLLFQELNKQVSQIPPFALNKELYQAGCNHAKQVLSKKIKNVKLGSKERKSLFPKAIRYKEICFVSAPISSINSDPETSKSLCSMILNHYSSDLKSGLNSIGPVLVPLKSKKILVIILFAFFQPYIPASKFKETFEPLSKQKIAPDDKSNFVKLINTFRSLAHFDELNMTKPKSKLPFCVAKYNYDCACSYSIQLFQRLMSYCNLYDLLIDYWTNFSIEVTPDSKDETCFKLTLTFWRFNSYVEYNVDVISLLQKEHKPEEITSKQQETVIEVPATSYYEDTTQDRVFQPIESTSYNPDLETKVALDDLYSNSQQNIKSEPPVPETPAEKFVSYDECKETTPSQETKIAIEEDLIRNQDIPPSNDTFNLDDIHTRGVVINLDETITKEEAKEEAMILKEENEIEDLKNETEIVKGEIAHEAQLLKNAIDKEVSGDKDEQKEAAKAEKKARKDRHSFNLVADALRRSSERFEAMAEAAGQVEEVLEGEYNNSLDFGEEDIIEKPQREKENEDEIEMINNLDDYIENDKITDNEKHSVLDFIAANEDEFAKGDRFDAYSSEALEMLKAEKANGAFDNTLIEEEEDTNGDNSEQQSIPDFQYDEKYEARSSEVNPVPEVESAKETELSTDFEYSNEIETEAAKQLGETV